MRSAAVALVVLIAAVLLAHWPELALGLSADPMPYAAGLSLGVPDSLLPGQPGWVDPNAGVTTQALGGLAARDWLHGEVPWWNPYSGAGLPLAAELQNQALFLPFVLLLALPGGLLLLKLALQGCAAVAMFALLRTLGLARGIALIGGVCFALNGTFAWMAHGPMMPVAFLPLMLLGVERARSGRRWGVACMAGGLALALLAGFPETAFIEGLFTGVWAILRLAQSRGRAALALAALLGIGAGLGLLLAAPGVLAFLELLGHSEVGVHAAGVQSIPRSNLALLLTPYAYGPIAAYGQWAEFGTMGGFVQLGLVPPALLALLVAGRERSLRRLLAAWWVVMLAEAAGLQPVAWLLGQIPFLGQAVVFRYVWPTWELASIVLACFGLEDWLARRQTLGGVALAVAAAAGAVAGGIGCGWQHLAGVPHVYVIGALLWAALVVAVVGRLLALPPNRRRAGMLGAALCAEAIGLFSVTLLSGTRNAALDLAAVEYLQAHIGLARVYTLGPLRPNYGALFAIASINHDYLPVPQAWPAYVRAHLFARADAISFVPNWPPTAPGQEDAATALRRHIAAYEAVGVRYILAYAAAAPFAGMPDAPAQVYRGSAIDIYELGHPLPYFSLVSGACRLAVASRGRLNAACDGAARLRRLEFNDDGWTARVNGARVAITTAGGIFQEIDLPPGNSVVRFGYAPPHSVWAVIGLGLGLAGLAASFLRRPPGGAA